VIWAIPFWSPEPPSGFDILAYDDPFNGMVFADSARTESMSLASIQAGYEEE
jgi:hypothetical protein